jgi:hypothetical protein
MWGFIQGNTFVNYPPFGTYALDGIYIPVLDPQGPSPIAFYPNNPADLQAVEAWTAGTLVTGNYSRIGFPNTPMVMSDVDLALPVAVPHTFEVSSTLVGQPVILLETPLSPVGIPCQPGNYATCGIIPGLGPLILRPQSQAFNLGTIPGTQILAVPLTFPPQWAGLALNLQAYVGVYPHHNFTQNTGELTEPRIVFLY